MYDFQFFDHLLRRTQLHGRLLPLILPTFKFSGIAQRVGNAVVTSIGTATRHHKSCLWGSLELGVEVLERVLEKISVGNR